MLGCIKYKVLSVKKMQRQKYGCMLKNHFHPNSELKGLYIYMMMPSGCHADKNMLFDFSPET